VSGLDKSISMVRVFKGVLWFLVADVITMAMFMYWPEIITCLPNLMK
jgi:TRAP-type C4-dicarboxylate transport system permease large subunit